MAKFRVERTELHTRVYFVDAESEDIAWEIYVEEGVEDQQESYHSGHPSVVVEEV